MPCRRPTRASPSASIRSSPNPRRTFSPRPGTACRKAVCFFTPAAKFKERYASFGFNPGANLDEGNLWVTSFAVLKIGPAEEKKLAALVKKAAG